jgi:pyrimidine-nucleoside phosphorylase
MRWLPQQIIARKRDGDILPPDAIAQFIDDYTAGRIAHEQAAALLMAIFLRGLNADELAAWTHAMLHSGAVLAFPPGGGFVVDKHSTGGVGDKISLILAPLCAEVGLRVPMMAGRSLGHTGGTLDKLEAIPGFRTQLALDRFQHQVQTLGCAIIGQTPDIAPADRLLYALRDATATVPCIPLIASSILSKKLAEGLQGLVLDVKTGSGAFMKSREDARNLADTMIGIGNAHGCRTVALVTDMNAPLGRAVGNALEVHETREVLQGAPGPLRELTLALARHMVDLALPAPDPRTPARLAEALDSGAAWQRFLRMVEAQGGDPRAVEAPGRLPEAPVRRVVPAPWEGVLAAMDCERIGMAGVRIGVGRVDREDRIDPAAGFLFHATLGDRLQVGDALVTVHAATEDLADTAAREILAACTFGDQAPAPLPPDLVLEVRTAG